MSAHHTASLGRQNGTMTDAADFDNMTVDQQIESLGDIVAEILAQYEIGPHNAECINHELNSTFAVTSHSGEKFALRINVNSHRTLENLRAETHWVNTVSNVVTPRPVANRDGEFVTSGWHEASGRKRHGVLYTWLEGVEPGDEPTLEQLSAAGAAMARLHAGARTVELPQDAVFPDFVDFFWGDPDVLLTPESVLTSDEREIVARAQARIEETLERLRERAAPQPIHADIHPGNMMWHEGTLAIFDFDDSGIGLPVQDLATSLYYLDNDEQVAAFLAGYSGEGFLPEYTPEEMGLLLLQRRIVLLNSLLQSSNPEHREEFHDYRTETIRRIAHNLG